MVCIKFKKSSEIGRLTLIFNGILILRLFQKCMRKCCSRGLAQSKNSVKYSNNFEQRTSSFQNKLEAESSTYVHAYQVPT